MDITPCEVCCSFPCYCHEIAPQDKKKVQGFVVSFDVHFIESAGYDELKEEVEEFIMELDDENIVDNFTITPVYVGEDDDEPS